MAQQTELSVLELEGQTAEPLPERHTMSRRRRRGGDNLAVAIAANLAFVEQNATAVAIAGF